MGRRERRLDPEAGPLQRFASDLRELRDSAGRPSYRELARRAHYSVTSLSEAAGGEQLPSLAITLAYVGACGGDKASWEARWLVLAKELAPAEPDKAPRCDSPYLGLATFEPQDADRFHGRDSIVADLVKRVENTPFVAVFGASGSGKSSVLRAGLLPALENHGGNHEWLTVLFTPGAHPMAGFAARAAAVLGISTDSIRADLVDRPDRAGALIQQILRARPGVARVAVVVDQFEEIFTLCADENERAAFIGCLVAAAERARVVLGVRADFFARCAQYPDLVAALRDRQVLIGPMEAADLRSVIRKPALQAGVRVEATLVDAIVTDAHGEPGALPLVSHALFETWNSRTGDTMTLATYRRVGGVQGAIARTAERVHEELAPRDRLRAKDIFLRLTALGEGTEDTRRRVTRDELLGGSDSAEVAAVLAKLATARLITMNAETVEVAHEALIRSWPRLRAWLADDREQLVNHRRLTETATEWHQDGRDDGMLFRGVRLLAWEGQDLSRLNDLELAFLAASRHRAELERRAARRRVRRLVAGLALVMVVLSVLATVALVQASEARAERTLALSRQLVASARAQLQLDPELALLLAKLAYATLATADTEAVLRQATLESRIREVVAGHGHTICGVAFSPDQRYLATSGSDGNVRMWQRGPLRDPIVLTGHTGNAWSPVFSPDGRLIVASGVDGLVTIWDWTVSTEPKVLRGHEGTVWSVTFSPDGRRVASVGDDGTVRIWPVAGGDSVVLRGHDSRTLGVAFSPDGSLLASSDGDGTIRIWTLATGASTVMRGHQNSVEAIAFSPDGARIASASTDGTVRTWDLHGQSTVLGSHDGTAEGIAYSRDGRRIVSTGNDGTVRVWNAKGGARPLILRGHRGTTIAAAFSPDSRQLASVGEDGTTRLWDATEVGGPTVRSLHQGASWAAAADPAGVNVASAGADGTVRILPLADTIDPMVLRGHEGDVQSVTYSPDGTRIASAGNDGTVRVWPLTGGSPLVLRHDSKVWNAAFSPDGQRVATSAYDGKVWLWRLDGSKPVVLQSNQRNIRWVAYSPDGKYIASAGYDGTVRVWDTATLGEPKVLRGHNGMVWSVAFSPDSTHLASAGNDGTVRIWPMSGGDPVVLGGHQGIVWGVTYSADGQQIASSGNDGAVRIWPLSGGEPVVVQGFGASVEVITASSTGAYVTAHDDGTVRVWTCEVCRPINKVLELAGNRTTRELTREERRVHLNEP